MAIFNEILSGRYNRALQKIFAIKGSAPVRQLGGEITPSHVFYSGVETRALEEWYRFGTVINLAAGVGQAVAQLRNPAGSNRLVVFEKISVSDDGVGGACVWNLGTQTAFSDQAGAFALSPAMSWDKRLNQASGMVGSLSSGGTATSLIRAFAAFPATGGNYDFITEEQQDIILSPGESIQIRATTNAKNLNTAWWWRERKFEPEEFNF